MTKNELEHKVIELELRIKQLEMTQPVYAPPAPTYTQTYYYYPRYWDTHTTCMTLVR